MPKQINYRKRIHLRIRKNVRGTAERPRVVVFRSLKNISLQAIDDSKGHTIISISTLEKEIAESLKAKNKTEVAREIGKKFAERLKSKNIVAVVYDRAGFRYHGRVQAVAEGMREAGIKV
jgi:large subunit ribosomal protein L18